MMIYFGNNLRVGFKIMMNNEPYEIEHIEFVKPGKGQAFARAQLRRILIGTRIEKIFKSSDIVVRANIVDTDMIYLYSDNEFWYFMHKKTFEQFAADCKAVGGNAKWLFKQVECSVTLLDNKPIVVTPPQFINANITDIHPYIKGNTIGANEKLAVLSTGAVIKVPSFIQINEIIKIDTKSGEYVSRAK